MPQSKAPTYRFSLLRSASLLVFAILVLLPLGRCALAQSSDPSQSSGGPPSGPPPDGGGPGGPPPSSSGSGSSGTAGTQQGRPGPPSSAMELDRIIEAMKRAGVPLTDAQKVAILGILEDKATAMQSLRNTSDRSSAMQEEQALEKTARKAILAVLTEAQQKVYATLHYGPPKGPPPANASSVGSSGQSSSSGPAADDGSNIDANTGGGIPAPPASAVQ